MSTPKQQIERQTPVAEAESIEKIGKAIQNRLILKNNNQLSPSFCKNIKNDLKQKIGRMMDSDDYYYQQDYPQYIKDTVNPTVGRSGLLTIFFYIRWADSPQDKGVQLLQECLYYLLRKEQKHAQELVGTIYLEKWAYEIIQP